MFKRRNMKVQFYTQRFFQNTVFFFATAFDSNQRGHWEH